MEIDEYGCYLAAVELRYSALSVCVIATFDAIQAGHFIRIGKVE